MSSVRRLRRVMPLIKHNFKSNNGDVVSFPATASLVRPRFRQVYCLIPQRIRCILATLVGIMYTHAPL